MSWPQTRRIHLSWYTDPRIDRSTDQIFTKNTRFRPRWWWSNKCIKITHQNLFEFLIRNMWKMCMKINTADPRLWNKSNLTRIAILLCGDSTLLLFQLPWEHVVGIQMYFERSIAHTGTGTRNTICLLVFGVFCVDPKPEWLCLYLYVVKESVTIKENTKFELYAELHS